MARKQSSVLTDAELRPMEVLWQRGSATVAAGHRGAVGKRRPQLQHCSNDPAYPGAKGLRAITSRKVKLSFTIRSFSGLRHKKVR